MNWLARLRRRAFGFFVDDAFLGLGTIAAVVTAALCRMLLNGRPLVAGAMLASGCLMTLTLSVARAAVISRRRGNDSRQEPRGGHP